jgi:Leucine-rich repeat (LRR) protein
MGCLKKNLHQVMVQFHIKELMENYYEFVEDDQNSAQAAIENSMPPDIPARSQLEEMTEVLIKNLCRESNSNNITYINLFNNKIKKITGLSTMANLKTLVLSFNEIEEIEGLENCQNLTKLDLHNNFIRQIKNLDNKEKITYLDLTHNWINDWA